MSNSRTSNSIKNSVTAAFANIISTIASFVTQTIFLKTLGAEFLGINGLFSNILTMLSLFDLGIGNAIAYHMYKPIADNDIRTIKKLNNFYRKAYAVIAIIIFLAGCILIPFVGSIVGEITIDINVEIVFVLFLLNTVSSYVLVYKRSLIFAHQKNYIINLAHCVYITLLCVLQAAILFWTKNYYLFLIIKIICQITENLVINIICNQRYPYIKEESERIDKTTEKKIFKNVFALAFHKVGEIIILGTDNIIISRFLGVAMVGIYSNYSLIINAISNLFGQVISSSTASIGNLMAKDDDKKIFTVFKRIRFINFWISNFTATALLLMAQPFIELWAGHDYLLGTDVLIILVVNYFQKIQRATYRTFKDSAGIWKEDKFIPLIESLINIVVSIILVRLIGISGVFIGTVISSLILWCFSYPKYVYKKIFNRSYLQYAAETIFFTIVFSIIAAIAFITNNCLLGIVNANTICRLIIGILTSIIVPNISMVLLFSRTKEFHYTLSLVKKICKKCKNK